jgi:hypothetical protein
MPAQQVNPTIVSEMPGHSKIGITLDIYSLVLPDMQQLAAAAMEAALDRSTLTLPRS